MTGPAMRLWHILLLALLLWGSEYLQRGLWEPDEARYAYVANEMRQDGQWAVPHRSGEIYAHKPPLMFWLMNLAALATGGEVNRVSARLPSLLGTILSLWVTARLATRWAGPRAAQRAVPILASAVLFWNVGGMGQIDALLCGLEMAAFYALLLNAERPAWRRALAAYALMGLAILAKGPVGLLVPLGAFVAVMLAGGEARALRGWHWLWGPLVTLAFPAAWLAWAWRSGAPEWYFRDLLFRQNVERAAGDLGHVQPFHYFAWHFPLEFLPWTIFLPAAWMGLRATHNLPLARRLAAWGLWVLVFFSLSASKRNLYVLMAYPAAALLVAAGWESMPRRAAAVSACIATGLLAALAAALLAAPCLPVKAPLPLRVLIPSGLVLCAGAAALVALRRRFPVTSSTWFAVFAGTLLLNQLCIANVVYPALNAVKTPVELARAAPARLAPGDRLLLYRMEGEIHALYAGVRGLKFDEPGPLADEMRRRGRGIVVTDRRWREELEATAVPLAIHPFDMGNKHLAWCEFGAAAAGAPAGAGGAEPARGEP